MCGHTTISMLWGSTTYYAKLKWWRFIALFE